jgi:glycerol uptake facilitator-like aquaporin
VTPSASARDLLAEAVGTGALVAVVVGSGAMAQRLSSDIGLQLFENAVATGAALFVLIAVFVSVSRAHFNPVVTMVAAFDDRPGWPGPLLRVAAQVLGAVAGVVVANLMFELPVVGPATSLRDGGAVLLAEVVATWGLTVVIFGLMRAGRHSLIAPAVGAYIGAAYFFTASTSFANPAVTIGRALTDSFAGIHPSSVPAFIGAQVVGAVLGWLLVRALWPVAGHSDPLPRSEMEVA